MGEKGVRHHVWEEMAVGCEVVRTGLPAVKEVAWEGQGTVGLAW